MGKLKSVKHKSRLVAQKKYNDAHREQLSVASHWYFIFSPKPKSHLNYEGMPFYSGWNPKKGGSFRAGADWIIKNLGKRPDGSTLHIVNHAKGFVPGNLEWTYPRKQNREQMVKVIARLKHRIRGLEKQLRKNQRKLKSKSHSA